MPNLLLKIKASNGDVVCFRDNCVWLDIGRPDDFALAQQMFEQIVTRFSVMRRAIVTGAQRFIGRSLVKALRRNGANVRTLGGRQGLEPTHLVFVGRREPGGTMTGEAALGRHIGFV
jgi:hypothetical protein